MASYYVKNILCVALPDLKEKFSFDVGGILNTLFN